MTQTYTTTESFTLTNAKYLASKVKAELLQVNDFYNEPSREMIEKYYEELVALLAGDSGGRYLRTAEYGFKKNNNWVFVLKYDVSIDGSFLVDDSPGRVPANEDTTGASWYTLLTYSSHFLSLPPESRTRIEASLPIPRGAGTEPSSSQGTWITQKHFTSAGVTLQRSVFKTW